jgi:hypothetical protein
MRTNGYSILPSVLVGALSLACTSISLADVLVSCGPAGYTAGDQFDRGFYVPSYPGASLQQVTLRFQGGNAGAGTITLTARTGTFGGSVIGTSTVNVVGPVSPATPIAFPFAGNPAVSPGSVVTFAITTTIANTTTPPFLFYSVATSGDPSCPVIETNGTTPPLDSFRRQGVETTISGDVAVVAAPIPTPTLSMVSMSLMFILVTLISWQVIRRQR